MFTVTKIWIMQHRTKRGSWTKEQIEALGLAYPVEAGWTKKLFGTQISESDKNRFEAGKEVFSKKSNRMNSTKGAISEMSIDQLEEIHEHAEYLITKYYAG